LKLPTFTVGKSRRKKVVFGPKHLLVWSGWLLDFGKAKTGWKA